MGIIRYRTETFIGSGERSALEVMRFETFELCNTDILESLSSGVLKNNRICKEFKDIMNYLQGNNESDIYDEEYQRDFFQRVLKEIKRCTGYNIKYALWLADKESVMDKTFYGKYVESGDDIQSYRVGEVVLSELGYYGTLYGYIELPKPL